MEYTLLLPWIMQQRYKWDRFFKPIQRRDSYRDFIFYCILNFFSFVMLMSYLWITWMKIKIFKIWKRYRAGQRAFHPSSVITGFHFISAWCFSWIITDPRKNRMLEWNCVPLYLCRLVLQTVFLQIISNTLSTTRNKK